MHRAHQNQERLDHETPFRSASSDSGSGRIEVSSCGPCVNLDGKSTPNNPCSVKRHWWNQSCSAVHLSCAWGFELKERSPRTRKAESQSVGVRVPSGTLIARGGSPTAWIAPYN